jgi:recombination protein RecT
MNAPVKQPSEITVVRTQIDDMAGQFQAALPAHIPVERFARVVMTAIQNNGDLLSCSRKSLFNAAMKAAQDGLLPDGREGAMVPYKGQVTWMPMVGGIRKKVRNSGEIATWDVHAVFENDAFEYELGDEPFIRHKPALANRGKLIAVYSIATLKSGEKSRDVMSVEDVEKIRSKSLAKNGPWSDPIFYPEMAKKTVARRHSKVLPMSSDLDDLIRRDDHLYDIEGAREEAQTDRPKSLAGRLDALADFSDDATTIDVEKADPETGEIVVHSNQQKPAKGKKSEQNADQASSPERQPGSADGETQQPRSPNSTAASAVKPASDTPAPGSDAGTPSEASARAAGADARAKGMSRKAIPAQFRKEPLLTAWLDGFDTGIAEDAEPGAEG